MLDSEVLLFLHNGQIEPMTMVEAGKCGAKLYEPPETPEVRRAMDAISGKVKESNIAVPPEMR